MENRKSDLAIVGSVRVPSKYGRFETLAHQLVLKLNEKLNITVYNSAKHYTKEERIKTWNGARIKYMPFRPKGIQRVMYDVVCMLHAILFSRTLLILGVSGCLFLPFLKLIPNRKVIVNIDGLDWSRKKWGKFAKKILLVSEYFAVRFADEIIADNAAIQKYVKDRYGINARLIEYGGDHAEANAVSLTSLKQFPILEQDYAFTVCRIEPENNVQMILEAFSKSVELPLVIVGNWDNSSYGQQLKRQYSNYENIHLYDSIFEQETLNALRSNAKLYVHGHSEGGTNPSLVEAMSLGLPILSYDVVYNRITTENEAIYFNKVEEIMTAIKYTGYLPLGRIGLNMQRIADRRYSWDLIADKYKSIVQLPKQTKAPVPTFNFELPIQLKQSFS